MSANGRVGAFFDLDKTLLTVNSGRLWITSELQHRRLSPWQAARGFGYLLGYHLLGIDMDKAIREALKTVAGLREEQIRAWTRAWFSERVTPHVAPGAWDVLRHHREAGHTLILLTSSSPYASECAIRHFGLDAYCSMEYEVRDGCFTGDVVSPLCYGDGKRQRAENLAREQGIDLDASYFYTDSATDLPMLRRVGHPRVVHPDPRLRRTARRQGWPILDWS